MTAGRNVLYSARSPSTGLRCQRTKSATAVASSPMPKAVSLERRLSCKPVSLAKSKPRGGGAFTFAQCDMECQANGSRSVQLIARGRQPCLDRREHHPDNELTCFP